MEVLVLGKKALRVVTFFRVNYSGWHFLCCLLESVLSTAVHIYQQYVRSAFDFLDEYVATQANEDGFVVLVAHSSVWSISGGVDIYATRGQAGRAQIHILTPPHLFDWRRLHPAYHGRSRYVTPSSSLSWKRELKLCHVFQNFMQDNIRVVCVINTFQTTIRENEGMLQVCIVDRGALSSLSTMI